MFLPIQYKPEISNSLQRIILPKTLGTLIIFPANYLHGVSSVTRGSRYSLITHVWGPEFK